MSSHTPISKHDIVDNETFAQKRESWRTDIIALKKTRRMHVGPDITFYFENKATLLWQIQEMLYIEKGGEEQLEDELLAYNPLVPKGNELVATMMIEIDDLRRRHVMLRQLSYIDQHVYLCFGTHRIQAIAEDDIDRTDARGKTSAIHFVRFVMTAAQANDFKHATNSHMSVEHPFYTHTAPITGAVLAALVHDL